jgi:hypothetical protein
MYIATLHLTRTGKPSVSDDDKIIIQHNLQYSNLFNVTYSTPELKMARTFTADESKIMDFIGDILLSLPYDHEPFEEVQVSTAIHPNILYAVANINCNVRGVILNTIRFALRADIKQKRITSE